MSNSDLTVMSHLKTSEGAQPSYGDEFAMQDNEVSLCPHERLCTRNRFETGGKCIWPVDFISALI